VNSRSCSIAVVVCVLLSAVVARISLYSIVQLLRAHHLRSDMCLFLAYLLPPAIVLHCHTVTLQGIVIDAFNSTVVSGGLDGQVLQQPLLFERYFNTLSFCAVTSHA
jgi:hypothetical protein